VSYPRLIHRRAFLLGAAAFSASCSRIRRSLGTLAYVDSENLWVRDLPDAAPRRVASGHRIAWPRISRSGRWISFQDGSLGRLVSTDGSRAGAQWNTGEVGESPLTWVGNRDQIAVCLADTRSGDPADSLTVFAASDNWRAPQWSIPRGVDVDFDSAFGINRSFTQYAYSSTTTVGQYPDGSGRYNSTLLLSSFRQPGESRRLAESEGFFDVAGFTPGGKWLLYWRSDDIGAAIREDGLAFLAANTGDGKSRDPKIVTLVSGDMIAISPTRDIVAVTSGDGRETWANKAIAVIDLSRGEPSVRVLSGDSTAAQLPAWSPDGEKLAWCSGPDAEFLDKQKLLAEGKKTITVEGPRMGERKEIPITPELRMGAEPETIDRCMRLRRIYAAGLGESDRSRQLTNDPHYSDEEPAWSGDGSHILFCRLDANDARTIWLMRSDGSEARQVAGPLRPPPDLTDAEKFSYKIYYGYTEWTSMFDWWHGPAV
jgi:hypothetical protein